MDIPAFPRRVTLELTNRCNVSCTFCPRHEMGDFLGMMETSLALRCIDEMARHLPVTLVPFFRGESLLHPDWADIIAHAKEKGLGPIQFTTNGTLLDDANARKLLRCKVDFMSFSLDTLDADIYEHTRRGASFAGVRENILHFLELHEAAGRPFPVQVSAVETEVHKPGMDAFVAFWRPRVSRVRVYAEHSHDGRPGSMPDSVADIGPRRPCKKVSEDMVILWNGDVAICNHDWQRQRWGEVFANVRESGIAGAWNCEDYRRLREAHATGTLEGMRPCDSCEQWKAFYLPEHCIGRIYENTARYS